MTDAEGMCGVELAPEETEQRSATKPESHQPEKPTASAAEQLGALGAPISERAAFLEALPAESLVRNPAECVKPLAFRADEVPVQELDLTSELGQVEAVSRGLNSPTFQALDELPEPHERSAEPTLESFALPTIAPARAPAERALLPRSACRARASKPNPPWLDSKSFGRNRTPICRNRSQAGRRSQHPGWKAKWPLLSNGT